jgi:predicted nuclease with TOPRIM domain
MEDILNYLLTSDFSNMDDSSPQQFKELLSKFRYEYRMLISKNTSLTHEIQKLKGELENVSKLLKERDNKYNIENAALEDKLHFTEAKLNKKLTLKERLNGKINRG